MIYLSTLLLIMLSYGHAQKRLFDMPEDATMTFDQLARKYTKRGKEYNLTVNGGYILKLFRIPGDKSRPVLFIHGAIDSSDSFIMRGNTSLAVALARNGYDIWAINLRGNRYSRRHTFFNPDLDSEYWDFSLHEFGYYDLPATIDFILSNTCQKRLSVIGYSEGTSAMLVLGATRREYNRKVKIFIALAPMCYMHNIRLYMSLLMDMAPILNQVYAALGAEEFVGYKSATKALIDKICLQKNIGYKLCLTKGLFLIVGPNAPEIEPEFLPIIMGHFPAGTSRKNLHHLMQIRSQKTFQNYDYGSSLNLLLYENFTPTVYDLSRVTMKISLFVAKNDRISTIKDVELLRQDLPNVVDYNVMRDNNFNHVDYVWGKNTHKTMFPHIYKLLNKYQ